jgi:hypothetical protein
MFERIPRKGVAGTSAALLLALGLGGTAIAATNGSQPAKAQAAQAEKPGVESTAPENSATDGDNVQYTGPNDSNAASQKNATNNAAAAQSSTGSEAPGTAQPAASESSGAAETPGSETAGNDGPGGHADEPGNANADHQAQGAE